MTVLWKCDECEGPAKWTSIDGVVYYHCERMCSGFMQLELDIDRRSMYIDKVASVSALDEDEDGPVWHDEIIEDQYRRFLNGS